MKLEYESLTIIHRSGVFCGDCCNKKQHLRYQGVKKMKKMRVCVDCLANPSFEAASNRLDAPARSRTESTSSARSDRPDSMLINPEDEDDERPLIIERSHRQDE
jgi:hypothetical protein